MPQFISYPRRYNSLRLLGYEYNSIYQLCAITLVTDLRRPVFADIKLAKSVLACLLSEQTLDYLRVRAFTLMPDHFHLLAGIRDPESNLSTLIGRFKSFTTQAYWNRSREIVESRHVMLPPKYIIQNEPVESRRVLSALLDWRITVRPELVVLKNWPAAGPRHFNRKRLWQTHFFDHLIRNDVDLASNIEYIAMNSVNAGYVTHPQFYPFTGFLG